MSDKCPICGNEVSIYQSNPDHNACFVVDGYLEPGKGRHYCMTCLYKAIQALYASSSLKSEIEMLNGRIKDADIWLQSAERCVDGSSLCEDALKYIRFARSSIAGKRI